MLRFLRLCVYLQSSQPFCNSVLQRRGVKALSTLSQMRLAHPDTATAAAYSERVQRLRELTKIQDQVVQHRMAIDTMHYVQSWILSGAGFKNVHVLRRCRKQ